MKRPERSVEAPPEGPWPARLGVFAGAALGLFVSFGLAALADLARWGSPEWLLRLASPLFVVLGAVLGARATRRLSAPGYRRLGLLAGVALAGILVLLLVALFGLAR